MKPMKKYKKIIHWLAHLLGWNYGLPDAFYEGDRLMMSFKCSGCGKRSGIHCRDKQLKQK